LKWFGDISIFKFFLSSARFTAVFPAVFLKSALAPFCNNLKKEKEIKKKKENDN
jgi:hypothetical protein